MTPFANQVVHRKELRELVERMKARGLLTLKPKVALGRPKKNAKLTAPSNAIPIHPASASI